MVGLGSGFFCEMIVVERFSGGSVVRLEIWGMLV